MFAPSLKPNLVSRPHLVKRLATGLEGPLTLISAPAGFGKTTLFSEWRAADGASTSVAWLSLDANDNDPLRFWSYVVAALQGVCPGLTADVLGVLRDSPQAVPEAYLTPLINAMDTPAFSPSTTSTWSSRRRSIAACSFSWNTCRRTFTWWCSLGPTHPGRWRGFGPSGG